MKKKRIGVDLGGTNIRCATIDEDGKILQIIKEKSEVHKGYQYVIEKMIRMIKSLSDYADCESIGVGCPGPLSAKEGMILSPINLPDWDRVPLRDILEKQCEKRVQIDNDANAAALGEAIFGAGKGFEIVQYITISTGIGAGLVINEGLVRGAHNCCGEVCNIIIEPNGYKHKVLNAGSFEGMCSGEAIERIAQERGLCVHSSADVFQLCTQGDAQALFIIKEVANNIAKGLATIAQVVDPDIFVLGGGVMNHDEILLPFIKEYYPQYVLDVMQTTRIVKANLEEPGLIGAALLAK